MLGTTILQIKAGEGVRFFRHRQFKAVLLLALFGFAAGLSSLQVEGQTNRVRRVNQTSPTREGKPEAKPDPTQEKPAQQDPKKPEKPEQKTPEPEAEPIRINSNLVAVPVSVTDADGEPVRNLTAEDFQLEEEGQLQQLQTLGQPGKTPIELALLFDVSRSVRNRFDFEREAAIRFLREIVKPGDTVSIFAIGRGPVLSIERTDNVEKAVAGTMTIEPTDEATAFFDTVVKAARYLEDHANPGTRRVLVVISDGEDTNSERFRLGDAQREIQRSDSLFYSINPSGPSIRLNKISMRGHEGMVRLANETGGMAFLPDKLDELPQVFRQIAAELQAQYLLGYYSTNETNDGKFRRISVRVPKKPELRIRARQGYYSPKD